MGIKVESKEPIVCPVVGGALKTQTRVPRIIHVRVPTTPTPTKAVSDVVTAPLAIAMTATIQAERTASEARMRADQALRDSLNLALDKIEVLTKQVNDLATENAALKTDRSTEVDTNRLVLKKLQEQNEELMKRIDALERTREYWTPHIKYVHRKRLGESHGNASGQYVDCNGQQIKPICDKPAVSPNPRACHPIAAGGMWGDFTPREYYFL